MCYISTYYLNRLFPGAQISSILPTMCWTVHLLKSIDTHGEQLHGNLLQLTDPSTEQCTSNLGRITKLVVKNFSNFTLPRANAGQSFYCTQAQNLSLPCLNLFPVYKIFP